jgi:hypothetical protein
MNLILPIFFSSGVYSKKSYLWRSLHAPHAISHEYRFENENYCISISR